MKFLKKLRAVFFLVILLALAVATIYFFCRIAILPTYTARGIFMEIFAFIALLGAAIGFGDYLETNDFFL